MSLCVRDILKGIVSLDQVILLDAGTMVNTCDKLTGLVRYYNDIYWRDWEFEQCLNVVETLLFTNRLRQERVMPKHDGHHLERSLTLHENRFGKRHGSHDVVHRLTHHDTDGCDCDENACELKLGAHWEVIDVVDSDVIDTDDETHTIEDVMKDLVGELTDIAHGRHEKCWD